MLYALGTVIVEQIYDCEVYLWQPKARQTDSHWQLGGYHSAWASVSFRSSSDWYMNFKTCWRFHLPMIWQSSYRVRCKTSNCGTDMPWQPRNPHRSWAPMLTMIWRIDTFFAHNLITGCIICIFMFQETRQVSHQIRAVSWLEPTTAQTIQWEAAGWRPDSIHIQMKGMGRLEPATVHAIWEKRQAGGLIRYTYKQVQFIDALHQN